MGLSSTLRNFIIPVSGIPIGYIFLQQVGYPARVDGNSMQPTLNPDLQQEDYVFLNRWVVRDKNIQRGDIVVFNSPKFPYQQLIKRVIGLSGDVIHTLGYKKTILQVPEEQCWVEGDYTGHSMDSNTFGPIPIKNITAKATCIVWPPNRWQKLKYYVPDRAPMNNTNLLAA